MAYLTELNKLTPIGWALCSSSIEKSQKILFETGFGVTELRPGSRQLPNDEVLEWTSLTIIDPWINVAPFLIEWASDSLHPSVDAPPGCHLTSMQIAGPQVTELEQILACLDIQVPLEYAEKARLEITLACSKGIVNF
jgi:hypothetical protein